MSNEQLTTIPIVDRYVREFYDLLLEQSSDEPSTNLPEYAIYGIDLLPTVTVFRGQLTEVFRSMGLSQNYYSRMRRILLDSGSITYIVRGTKAYDSVVVLNHPPPEKISSDLLTGGSGYATIQALAERLAETERRLGSLEAWFEGIGGINISEALADHERRLSKQEKREDNGT